MKWIVVVIPLFLLFPKTVCSQNSFGLKVGNGFRDYNYIFGNAYKAIGLPVTSGVFFQKKINLNWDFKISNYVSYRKYTFVRHKPNGYYPYEIDWKKEMLYNDIEISVSYIKPLNNKWSLNFDAFLGGGILLFNRLETRSIASPDYITPYPRRYYHGKYLFKRFLLTNGLTIGVEREVSPKVLLSLNVLMRYQYKETISNQIDTKGTSFHIMLGVIYKNNKKAKLDE